MKEKIDILLFKLALFLLRKTKKVTLRTDEKDIIFYCRGFNLSISDKEFYEMGIGFRYYVENHCQFRQKYGRVV